MEWLTYEMFGLPYILNSVVPLFGAKLRSWGDSDPIIERPVYSSTWCAEFVFSSVPRSFALSSQAVDQCIVYNKTHYAIWFISRDSSNQRILPMIWNYMLRHLWQTV